MKNFFFFLNIYYLVWEMWGVGLDFVLVCCLKSNGVFFIVGWLVLWFHFECNTEKRVCVLWDRILFYFIFSIFYIINKIKKNLCVHFLSRWIGFFVVWFDVLTSKAFWNKSTVIPLSSIRGESVSRFGLRFF